MPTFSESSLVDWIAQNKKAVGGVLGALVLLLAVQAGWSALHEKKLVAGANALHDAEESLAKELKIAGTTPIADVDRQLTGTVTALKKITEEFSGIQAGWEAQFRLGDLYMKYEPRTGRALPVLQAAVAAAPSTREKLFALYALAYAFEKQGKFDEAVQQLDAAIQLGQPYLKAEISLSRARLLSRAGKTAEADKAFDQVARDFANTDMARKADQWKAIRSL